MNVNGRPQVENPKKKVLGVRVTSGEHEQITQYAAEHQLKQTHHFEDDHKRALTVPEQELFLEFLAYEKTQYHHWYPIFAVMLGTGMRVGEICGLRWDDIDLENDMIDVNHTLVYYNHATDGCYFNIHTPKTKAGEWQIPMLQNVRDAFEQEKAYQEYNRMKCKVAVDGFTNFIFINRFGNLQHQGTLNKALRRIIRDCNDRQLLKGGNNPVLLPNFSCQFPAPYIYYKACRSRGEYQGHPGTLRPQPQDVTLDIYITVTKELKQREFGNFEEKMKQQKQEWAQNKYMGKEGSRFPLFSI